MFKRRKVLVINPNSNGKVTEGLRQALAPFACEGGPEIQCETLSEGSIGIDTREHVDGIALPFRPCIEAADDLDAFFIADYSDLGIHIPR